MKDNISDFIARVNEDKDSDIIMLTWHIDDVRYRELELTGKDKSCLTDEQCREILGKVLHYYDCTIGITWDSFDDHIEEIINKLEG